MHLLFSYIFFLLSAKDFMAGEEVSQITLWLNVYTKYQSEINLQVILQIWQQKEKNNKSKYK